MAARWPEDADRIVAGLIGAEFAEAHLPAQQTLCLVEEAGELVKAFRRWKGWARTPGSFDAVRLEAADVVITARVTCRVFGWDWPNDGDPGHRSVPGLSDWQHVLRVSRMANNFANDVEPALTGQRGALAIYAAHRYTLELVEATTYRAADCLGFDLDAAVAEKLVTVFSRGWRKEPTDA